MPDQEVVSQKKITPDWLLRGALARIGDSIDKITGRRNTPTSSLATSELIERLKRLLDSQARKVDGKGMVVPHNIRLKVQWDKFSVDAEESMATLQRELLTASVDHINDSHYYTLAPLHLEVKADYFIQGVKLFVSFDEFNEEEREAELNVTMPSVQIFGYQFDQQENSSTAKQRVTATYNVKGDSRSRQFELSASRAISVGRTGGNDLVLDDVSVSKTHASISLKNGEFFVADVGSTNGTYVNGDRIAYGKAIRFTTADEVKFGDVVIHLEVLPEPEETSVMGEADSPDESVSGWHGEAIDQNTHDEPEAEPESESESESEEAKEGSETQQA